MCYLNTKADVTFQTISRIEHLLITLSLIGIRSTKTKDFYDNFHTNYAQNLMSGDLKTKANELKQKYLSDISAM